MKHLRSLFDKLCTPGYHVVANLAETIKVSPNICDDKQGFAKYS